MRRVFLLFLFLYFLRGAARARAEQGDKWLRERISLEWMVGAVGWRTGIAADGPAPGFQALGGGGELWAGIDVIPGLGVVASGRLLGGTSQGQRYLEGLGGLGLQLRVVDVVRLRAGAAAGQLLLGDAAMVLVGGFVVGSIDLFALGNGRLATALALRLDVDGVVERRDVAPTSSLALSVGIGVHY